MTDPNLAEIFLAENSYCVLAVEHPEGPHAAMMHFAMGEDALDLYFTTSPGSRKVEAFKGGNACRASIVVGSGEKWKTLQMDGTLTRVSDENETEVARNALYAKYPTDKYKEHPGNVFMKFHPTWYRYSDFSTDPPLILPWKN